MADASHTLDRPAPGLVIAQPNRGFRYGAEAFWVVGRVLERGLPTTALDLGTGSGIMAALLARRGVTTRGIELRPEWEPLWRQTRRLSQPMPSLILEQADVHTVVGSVDCVVSNPPFFRADTGSLADDPWRRAARTESTATLADFVHVALGVLKPTGTAVFVVPVEREGEVLEAAGARQGHASAIQRIGRRRVILTLEPRPGPPPQAVQLGEQDDQVVDWIQRARAPIAAAPGPE